MSGEPDGGLRFPVWKDARAQVADMPTLLSKQLQKDADLWERWIATRIDPENASVDLDDLRDTVARLRAAAVVAGTWEHFVQPDRVEMAKPEKGGAEACTGTFADFCPIHGRCTCKRGPEGAWVDGPETENCPLHGVLSDHPYGTTKRRRDARAPIHTATMDGVGAYVQPPDLSGVGSFHIIKTPRRIRIDQQTPAEAAIRAAIDAVEALPPDVRLTQAVNLLAEAKNLVADVIEKPMTARYEGYVQ